MATTLLVLAVIITLIIILTILMGNKMIIERSITIDKPGKQVFDYIKITKNQDNFSTWNMLDPEMKKEYRGTDGQVGFVYRWDSSKNKSVGAGEQEIKKIEEGKSVEYEVRFIRPMQNIANTKFVLSSEGANQTRIQWLFNSPTKFPMTMMKPIFQKMLGKDMETGLQNLKSILEK